MRRGKNTAYLAVALEQQYLCPRPSLNWEQTTGGCASITREWALLIAVRIEENQGM